MLTEKKSSEKNREKYQRRKEKEELMKDLGLTKVKGSLSGKTYWE